MERYGIPYRRAGAEPEGAGGTQKTPESQAENNSKGKFHVIKCKCVTYKAQLTLSAPFEVVNRQKGWIGVGHYYNSIWASRGIFTSARY